jgi:hypothetical protein
MAFSGLLSSVAETGAVFAQKSLEMARFSVKTEVFRGVVFTTKVIEPTPI